MIIRPRALAATLLFSLAAACAPGEVTRMAPDSSALPAPAAAPTGPEAWARTFVDHLAAGRFPAATERFDETMKKSLPDPVLGAVWARTVATAGAYQGVDSARIEPKDGYRIVVLMGRFTGGRRELKVVYGAEDRIAGFFILPVAEDLEKIGRGFVETLGRGDFTAATAGFDTTMTAVMPPPKLEATWKQVEGQAGAFKGIEGVKILPTGEHMTVLVTCRFDKAPLVAKVVLDPAQKIAGLFFAPVEAEVAWQPPSYARPDAFTEKPVTVGAAPALPGTLTLPVGKGPFPVVILVHGSGPQDADETVGAARPFKDLAHGLAGKGVAVLRYVKRSRHAPAGVVGVKEEVLDAARDAVDLCQKTAEIDPARVVVLGHSQGGELAPRIAAENKAVAGVVMLAAPSRPLQDLVVDQFTYLASLDPKNPALSTLIEAAKAFKKRLDDPALKPDEEVTFPGGPPIKASYFLSMRGHDPAKVAAGLSIPFLILQGDRDYQVTAPDLDRYKQALGKKPSVVIKQYPRLNHLFIAGDGPSSPPEYNQPGHVDEVVIDDIAAWVGKLGKK